MPFYFVTFSFSRPADFWLCSSGSVRCVVWRMRSCRLFIRTPRLSSALWTTSTTSVDRTHTTKSPSTRTRLAQRRTSRWSPETSSEWPETTGTATLKGSAANWGAPASIHPIKSRRRSRRWSIPLTPKQTSCWAYRTTH